jgi:endonuclease YncB( thermonuclease family)
MKLFVFLLALLVPSIVLAAPKTPKGVTYSYEIIRVVDGDTVEFKADFLPDPLDKKLSLRVWGVDTPEKSFRAQCDSEKKLGEDASKFTKKLLAEAKKTEIVIYDWDKFGGRVLGDVLIDDKSLTRLLIDNGYAREYYGDAKKSWCENG